MLEFGNRLQTIQYPERLCAYAIMFNREQQVAVIGLPQGVYLPGGGVDQGETLEQGLRREILEETGHTARIGAHFTSAAQYRNESSRGYAYKKVGHYFFATLGEKVIEPIEADHQLLWRDPASAIMLLKHEAQQWALKEALRLNERPGLWRKLARSTFVHVAGSKLLGNHDSILS